MGPAVDPPGNSYGPTRSSKLLNRSLTESSIPSLISSHSSRGKLSTSQCAIVLARSRIVPLRRSIDVRASVTQLGSSGRVGTLIPASSSKVNLNEQRSYFFIRKNAYIPCEFPGSISPAGSLAPGDIFSFKSNKIRTLGLSRSTNLPTKASHLHLFLPHCMNCINARSPRQPWMNSRLASLPCTGVATRFSTELHKRHGRGAYLLGYEDVREPTCHLFPLAVPPALLGPASCLTSGSDVAPQRMRLLAKKLAYPHL